MTVQELIDELMKITDKSKKVYVYSYEDWSLCQYVEEDDKGNVEVY